MRTTRELALIELQILGAFEALAHGDAGPVEALIARPMMVGPISEGELRRRYFDADRYDGATVCLHRGCDGGLTECHLVHQRALRHVAEAGHVVEFQLPHDPGSAGGVEPTSVGIRRFSTFPGFCNAHDTALFRPIDVHDPSTSVGQQELLAWHARSVAATLVRNKRNLAKEMNFASLALAHTDDRVLRRHTFLTAWRTLRGEAQLVPELRRALEGNTSAYEFRSHAVERALPFACAGFCTVDRDFDRVEIPATDVMSPPAMTLAIVPGRHWAAAFFVCRREHAGQLMGIWGGVTSSLMADEILRLVSYCARTSLRVGLRPSWWEGLPDEVKGTVTADIDRAVHGLP